MKVPIKNPGNSPMFVGSKMIHPGETGHFEPDELPAHLRPKPVVDEQEEIKQTDPLAEMLERPVKDIVLLLLPDLTDEDLDELSKREQQAEKPRSTLLNAISDEIIERAIKAEEAEKQAAAAAAAEAAKKGD